MEIMWGNGRTGAPLISPWSNGATRGKVTDGHWPSHPHVERDTDGRVVSTSRLPSRLPSHLLSFDGHWTSSSRSPFAAIFDWNTFDFTRPTHKYRNYLRPFVSIIFNWITVRNGRVKSYGCWWGRSYGAGGHFEGRGRRPFWIVQRFIAFSLPRISVLFHRYFTGGNQLFLLLLLLLLPGKI